MSPHIDENDLPDEEILRMWDEGEPTDVRGQVVVLQAPWLRSTSRTISSARAALLSSVVELGPFGPGAFIPEGTAIPTGTSSDMAPLA